MPHIVKQVSSTIIKKNQLYNINRTIISGEPINSKLGKIYFENSKIVQLLN